MQHEDLLQLQQLLMEYEESHPTVGAVCVYAYTAPLLRYIDAELAAPQTDAHPPVTPQNSRLGADFFAQLARGEMPS